MTRSRRVLVPTLGEALLQPITFGVLVDIEEQSRDVSEADRPQQFSSLVISAMLLDPELSSEDVEKLDPEAIETLCRLAAEYLGASDDFAELTEVSSPRQRLFRAHRRSREKHVQRLNRSVSTALETIAAPLQSQLSEIMKQATVPVVANIASSAIQPFLDSLGKMAALSYRISAPRLLADDLRQSIQPIKSAYEQFGVGKSLAEMTSEIAKSLPTEPLLSLALISSGLNSALLHSPTYPIPFIKPLDLENWEVAEEETEHSRRVDAFDTLSSLEESLRDLISGVMNEEHGPNWWKRNVPQDVRNDCRERKERKEQPHRPSLHPIYFANVGDYLKIISRSDNWRESFEPIFGNRTELEACFIWVINVRDPVAHARPVDDSDYTMFYAGSLWLRERIDRALASLV